jgi:hypothetical protein
MSRRADHRPPPRLPYRAHHYVRRVEGRAEGCAVCPLPARNRVHDEDAVSQLASADPSPNND